MPHDDMFFNTFAEKGKTGLKVQAGSIQEEFIRDLQGPRKHKIYQEMIDNEPLINGTYFAIRQLI